MHSKKHNDCLTIPLGLNIDNETVVEMAFSCGGSSRGINGFRVFTQDETAIINHILENGRRKYLELVAQNERTIFTFLSSTERYSVPYFLCTDNSGFPIIEPDYIYDYFEKLFRGEPYGSMVD